MRPFLVEMTKLFFYCSQEASVNYDFEIEFSSHHLENLPDGETKMNALG